MQPTSDYKTTLEQAEILPEDKSNLTACELTQGTKALFLDNKPE